MTDSCCSELLRAGRKLSSLGHDISSIEAVLHSVGATVGHSPHDDQRSGSRANVHTDSTKPDVQRTGEAPDLGTRLAEGSAADLQQLSKDSKLTNGHTLRDKLTPTSYGQSPHKRKREEPRVNIEQQLNSMPRGQSFQRGQSRDLMPPPPLPDQRPLSLMANVPRLDHRSTGSHDSGERYLSRLESIPATPNRRLNGVGLGHQSNGPHFAVPSAPSATTDEPQYRDFQSLRFDLSPNLRSYPNSPLTTRIHQQNGGTSYPIASSTPFARSPISRSGQCYHAEPPLFAKDVGGYRATGPSSSYSRSGRSLGLSNNARSSSSYTPNSTPANPGYHRRPLGGGISASPHFPTRQLPSTLPRSQHSNPTNAAIGSFNTHESIFAARGANPTLHRDNFFVTQANNEALNTGRRIHAEPQTYQPYDLPRTEAPIEHVGSSSRLRRAHR